MSAKSKANVNQPPDLGELLEHPTTGLLLTVLSSLSFMLTLMCLPLVGPAGTVVAYSRQNFVTFLSVLLITLALSGMALYSKLQRRKKDQSPFPFVSAALVAACCCLLLVLFGGLLKI